MAELTLRASVERVWTAAERLGLTPTKRSSDFHMICPLHGDRTPSLHVTWKPEGFTLLHCFGCHAAQSDLVEALGLRTADLFDEPKEFTPSKSWVQSRKASRARKKLAPLPARLTLPGKENLRFVETKVYDYTTNEGLVVQQVVKEEAPSSAGTVKRFTQRFMGPTGRMVKRRPAGFEPLLYRWPQVIEAMDQGQTVWIVEGEKDAETAVDHGLEATTNAQGAGNFPAEFGRYFTGADVVVAIDRDQAGYERGYDLINLLADHQARSVVVYLPATPEPKSDVSDHFAAGYGVEDFQQISADELRVWALAEKVRHQLSKVVECEQETMANLQVKAGKEATPAQLKAAGRWADESYSRWGKLLEFAKETFAVIADSAPSDSIAEAEQLVHTVSEQATAVAMMCHAAAQVSAPADLLRSHEQKKPATASPVGAMSVAAAPTEDNDLGGPPPPAVRGHIPIEGDDGSPNIGTTFTLRNGQTVQLKWVKDDGEYVPRFHTVIHGWAEIRKIMVSDDGDESDTTTPADMRWMGTFYRWVRDVDGEPSIVNGQVVVEGKDFNWGPEELKNGNWVNHMPWPGMLESTSSRGKDTALQALMRAQPAPSQRTPVYTTTGWRDSDTGSFFVHAEGAMSTGGNIQVETDLPTPFKVYKFDEPTTDAKILREAWESGTGELMLAAPARIIAPMLGMVWRSFAASVRVVTHLAGGAGSGKTALARQVMHYAAPDLTYLGVHREILSATNKGSTALGLMRALERLAYLPTLVDDFTPDGDLKKAQQKLDEVIRNHYNASPRVVSTRDGGVKSSRPSLATLVTTAEFTPSGSAGTRALTIAVNSGDIHDPGRTFRNLERPQLRNARGLIGATFVAWLAANRAQLMAEEAEIMNDPEHPQNVSEYWTNRLADLPHTDGAKGRMVEGATEATKGYRMMLAMLLEYQVISVEEAKITYDWAMKGIYSAFKAQDATTGDAGEQLMYHLREALSTQSGHLTDENGSAPSNPTGAGWAIRGRGPDATAVAMGNKLGIIRHVNGEDRVYLLPNSCIRAARQVALGADIAFTETSTTISSSFLAHGWIVPDSSGARCVSRRVGGVKQRVWDIPLAVLYGDDEGQDPLFPEPPNPFEPETPQGPEPTQPSAPAEDSLFSENTEEVAPAAVASHRADAEGTEGVPAALGAPAACLKCHRPLDQIINGVPLCWPDWKTSTSRTRQALIAGAQKVEEPAVHQDDTAAGDEETAIDEIPAPEETPTKSRSGFAFAAAVLDADGLWTPDGVLHPLEPYPTHAGDIAHLATQFNLGARIGSYKKNGVTKYKTARGSIWITEAAALRLGLPVDARSQKPLMWNSEIKKLTLDHPTLLEAINDGWTVGGSKTCYTAWTRVYRGVEGAILVLLPALDPSARSTPLIADAPEPAILAKRLEAFSRSIGHPFLLGSSSTGLDLMFSIPTKEKRELYFASSPYPEQVYAHRMPEPEINWSRVPTKEEAAQTFVHAYDRSGSYLAGTVGAILPYGPLTHHPEGTAFDPKTPGYWLIDHLPLDDWRLPNALWPRQGVIPDQIWVTTPTLALALEQGQEPTIHQAYTWTGGRILDAWGQRIDAGRVSLSRSTDPTDKAVLKQVKRVYTESIGMMFSDHLRNRAGEGYAPERRDTIIGRSKVNLLRRVLDNGTKSGRWPVAIGTDTIVYTSNDPDPISSWPGDPRWLGIELGRYHHLGSHLLSEHSQFLTGRGYVDGGLDHLKAGIELVAEHARDSA